VISGDGRAVAFTSYARNLVPDDTNSAGDVFLHTLRTGKTERVSLNNGGVQVGTTFKGEGSGSASLSRDGQIVAFLSVGRMGGGVSREYPWDSYVYNRKTQRVTKVQVTLDGSDSKDGALAPSISPDGRYVSFTSAADNLVRRDTNSISDVFVRDLRTGRYQLVSASSAGRQGNAFSGSKSLVANGGKVVFSSTASNLVPNDTNATTDVFVRRF
jgi:Tol biopolymer transport system component